MEPLRNKKQDVVGYNKCASYADLYVNEYLILTSKVQVDLKELKRDCEVVHLNCWHQNPESTIMKKICDS